MPREGPGCNEATKIIFSSISNIPKTTSVLDPDCGPGNQTIKFSQLLKVSKSIINAVEKYLEELALKVLEQRIDNIEMRKRGSVQFALNR